MDDYDKNTIDKVVSGLIAHASKGGIGQFMLDCNIEKGEFIDFQNIIVELIGKKGEFI